MRILLSGSTGLIGTALQPALRAAGHAVVPLVRRPEASGEEVAWDPDAGRIDTARLDGFDAVIHLAGENIAKRRWSAAQRARIRDSRVGGTRLLSEALAARPRPPAVFVAASAIGYYGDRGDTPLTEASPPGSDFLATTCVAWERASVALEERGCRVVRLRIGVVQSQRGGALHRMLPLFRLGLGGPLGTGRQMVSWIALDDVAGIALHALATPALAGACNATAPGAVSNAEFARTLGCVLRRPAMLRAPAFALRLMLGEMADALLLSSSRVLPQRLLSSGYAFRLPELEGALRHLLERPDRRRDGGAHSRDR